MESLPQMFEIVLWVIFAVWLFRRIFRPRPSQQVHPPRVEKQPPAPMKTLHRDPSCGTYVAEDISHRLEEGGKTLHFCSEECRMRYIARQRHSARA